MKFKPGDRVVAVKNCEYGSCKKGTIIRIPERMEFSNDVFVSDQLNQTIWVAVSARRRTKEENLVLESVYNSKLYRLLHEV